MDDACMRVAGDLEVALPRSLRPLGGRWAWERVCVLTLDLSPGLSVGCRCACPINAEVKRAHSPSRRVWSKMAKRLVRSKLREVEMALRSE